MQRDVISVGAQQTLTMIFHHLHTLSYDSLSHSQTTKSNCFFLDSVISLTINNDELIFKLKKEKVEEVSQIFFQKWETHRTTLPFQGKFFRVSLFTLKLLEETKEFMLKSTFQVDGRTVDEKQVTRTHTRTTQHTHTPVLTTAVCECSTHILCPSLEKILWDTYSR